MVIFGKNAPSAGLLRALAIITVAGWLIAPGTLPSSWGGRVVDIRTERKQQAAEDWQVGDYQRKVKGEYGLARSAEAAAAPAPLLGIPVNDRRRQGMNNTPHFDVLGWGMACVDEVLLVDHFPQPDEKMSALEVARDGGGLTATALVAVARLGGQPAYAGVMGYDDLSREAVAGLQAEGVDCSQVLYNRESTTGLSRVVVDRSTGGRFILGSGSHRVPRPAETVTPALIGSARVLFVDPSMGDGGLRGAQIACEMGIPVVADIERALPPATLALMQYVDHLVVGQVVGRLATGCADPADAAVTLGQRGFACAVVTAGERGAWFSVAGGSAQHQPIYPIPVVDTNGCGDVFHGAYALCVARGLPLGEAVRVASATAALKVRRLGGRHGIPTWDEVQALISGR